MRMSDVFVERGNRNFADKVRRVAEKYWRLHGFEPDVCYVHPNTTRSAAPVDGIRIEYLSSLQTDQFLAGLSD